MWTRREYVIEKKCTHREYYGQFVTPQLRDSVARCIGAKELLDSTDSSFNDIPLIKWDSLPWFGVSKMVARANGSGGISLSDKVCVMKEAARQYVESKSHI